MGGDAPRPVRAWLQNLDRVAAAAVQSSYDSLFEGSRIVMKRNRNLPADMLTRRRILEHVARTSLGVGLLPTLGLASGSKARAQQAGAPGIAEGPAKAQRLIYLFMSGGMTHLDTFDVKPGSETQGQTSAISTSEAGVQFGEYLPTLAENFDKLAVVRSMNTQTADHEAGEYLMRTSYDAIATERHPSIGPWMQTLKGRRNKSLPDSVVIGAPARHPLAGFLDPSCTPLPVGDPNKGLENTAAPGYLTDESFERRLALINAFDRTFSERYAVRAVRDYSDFYDEAVALLSSEELKAFDLNEEEDDDRDRYGRNGFGQGCMLARRLVENNVQCVEVTLGGWDMHNTLWGESALPDRAGTMDQAVGALLTDLDERGLLADTLVVLTTEFGRSPQVNYNAGRDHHPAAFSSLLAGAGIRGGQVYGRSDKKGHAVEENGVSAGDFNATIAAALGLPLQQEVHSPTGRPFKVAGDGKPVSVLLS
jgi:hypothetical protein